MSSCWTLRLKRRSALSSVSPSWIWTSAKLNFHHLPVSANRFIIPASRILEWNLTVDLEQLARRARQLAAIGQLQAAREHWVAALQFLPTDSAQRNAVL